MGYCSRKVRHNLLKSLILTPCLKWFYMWLKSYCSAYISFSELNISGSHIKTEEIKRQFCFLFMTIQYSNVKQTIFVWLSNLFVIFPLLAISELGSYSITHFQNFEYRVLCLCKLKNLLSVLSLTVNILIIYHAK